MTDVCRAKQYKTQIKRWGLEKNVKDNEMRAVIRMQRKRKEIDGKESEFLLRDRVVPPQKITRYMKRTGLSANAPLSRASASTPSDIICYTPSGGDPSTPDAMSNIRSTIQNSASSISPAYGQPLETLRTTAVNPNSILTPNIFTHLGPPWDTHDGQAITFVSSAPPAWGIAASSPTPIIAPFSHTPLPEWAYNTSPADFNNTRLPVDMFSLTYEYGDYGPDISINSLQAGVETNTPPTPSGGGGLEALFGGIGENFTPTIQEEEIMARIAPEISINMTESNQLATLSQTTEDASAVQLLFENNLDISSKDFDNAKALIWAAEKGHEAVLRLLIKDGADVNAKGKFGRFALYYAAMEGHERILRLLLDEGAMIDSQDDNGDTALQVAAFLAQEKAVRVLLDYGADVHTHDTNKWTALHGVTLLGSDTIARLLIERGADFEALDNEGRPPLHEAARIGHEELVRLLLKYGSDVNARNNKQSTALHGAALNGNRRIVELLINNGANLDAKDEEGQTALFFAAFARERAVVRVLINKGANLKVKDNGGLTVLHAAVCLDDKRITQLNENRLRVQKDDEDSMAKWRWALKYGHEAVVRLLLEKDRSDLNSQSEDGRTMLVLAAINGHDSVVRLALENGANINTTDETGMTALHWTAKSGRHTTVKLLLENGAKIEAREEEYDGTALHLAAANGHEKVIEVLLEMGADIQATGGVYSNAVQAAIAKGHESAAQMLIERGADVNAQGAYFGTHNGKWSGSLKNS